MKRRKPSRAEVKAAIDLYRPLEQAKRERAEQLIESILQEEQYMMIRISINIDAHPGEGYGSMQFSEQAEFKNADFDIVSKVFTQAHNLLATLKNEHRPAK